MTEVWRETVQSTVGIFVQPRAEHVRIEGHLILWTTWDMARDYAQARSVLYHRKQTITSKVIDGRRYWHVRSVPMNSGGSA